MPKVTLTYDLSDPDDAYQHACARAGTQAIQLIEQLDKELQDALKYVGDDLVPMHLTGYEATLERLNKLIDSYPIVQQCVRHKLYR